MNNYLSEHPILNIPQTDWVTFYFEDQPLQARKDSMITSALMANGIDILNRHPKDNLPQGLFCANGQCSQCLIIADQLPVKGCITPITAGMRLSRLIGKPLIESKAVNNILLGEPRKLSCDVLIVGGGPAGLSAALYLADFPLSIIIADDKAEPGGKLTLQTHQFFGSIEDCYAGTRGTEIAKKIRNEIARYQNIRVLTQTTIAAVFEDKKAGAISPQGYTLIEPRVMLNATGAREKMLSFPGACLPNIYGAGAFQTLVNRDLIKAAKRVLVVGGGNVGLIAAYHALQAGIEVVAVIEAQSKISGYLVHRDKIRRLGVPLLTHHSIKACYGQERVEFAEIVEVDSQFQPIPGTEKLLAVDAVLIGVGLNPIDELAQKARQYGLSCYSAGDAQEIAEASAAFFGGKIAAAQIARDLNLSDYDNPQWKDKMDALKSRPGACIELHYPISAEPGFQPILHCYQSIPCNPCSTLCPQKSIVIPEADIAAPPQLNPHPCIGCFRCVVNCPGLAITLFKKTEKSCLVYIPYELSCDFIKTGDTLKLTDYLGNIIGDGILIRIFNRPPDRKRQLLEIKAEESIALRAAGIQLFDPQLHWLEISDNPYQPLPHFICRCEHVTLEEVEKIIDEGITDINFMKTMQRVTMGGCGGKSCQDVILQTLQQKKIVPESIVRNQPRPFLMEIPLQEFAQYRSSQNEIEVSHEDL